MKHNKVPVYMCCCNAFVLPTLAEGCCNAVIEATACGLPIISYDLPVNHDILNRENAILIDPNSVSEISDAIRTLKENESLREELSRKSLETAPNSK